MSTEPEKTSPEQGAASSLPRRLVLEAVIGLGLAGILILVAWASSTAIRFVYGGY
jgi:hypothetical protein